MAVVNTKSTAVTNADSSTFTLSSKKIASGKLRESAGVVAVANGDSIGSVLRFARVHSSWRVTDVLLGCTAVTSAAGDIGLYDIAAAGGAVVDADFFASAVSIATAITTYTQQVMESAADPALVANVEKSLWELLGLSADPGKFYDVAMTLTAAATAAGYVALKVRTVQND